MNISSGLTRIVMANRAAYGTMKAAVEAMTKYMAFELGPRRITVNVVAPGPSRQISAAVSCATIPRSTKPSRT